MKPFIHTLAGVSLAMGAAVLDTVTTPALAESLSPAFTGDYVNDPGHTRFLWRIPHLGLSNYTARINAVSMTLKLDAVNIENSSVAVTIDPRGIDTAFVGDEDFDKKIATNAEILNAEAHPSIDFRSTEVVDLGDGKLSVTGELTLLGVSLPVTMEATMTGSTTSHPFVEVPALGFHAIGVVDRTGFGLDFLADSLLGEEISIEVTAEFLKQ